MTWMAVMYAVLVAAWVPHIYSFYKSWQARKNPISLAICLTVTFVAFTNLYLFLAIYDTKTPEAVQAVAYGFASAAVVIYFYVARRCAARTFNDDRKN